MRQPLWFWDCKDEEVRADKSFSNPFEAQRVSALTLFLICQGVSPPKITILAAYTGQVRLIKRQLTADLSSVIERMYPELLVTEEAEPLLEEHARSRPFSKPVRDGS